MGGAFTLPRASAWWRRDLAKEKVKAKQLSGEKHTAANRSDVFLPPGVQARLFQRFGKTPSRAPKSVSEKIDQLWQERNVAPEDRVNGSMNATSKHRRQSIPDSRRIISVTATRAAMACGHVHAAALGFAKHGTLVHFDGRETRAVSLKQSVGIVAEMDLGQEWGIWDEQTRDYELWVKWLRKVAKAIR